MPLPGRAHTKTQNELKSVETERRADRRDRSALASRLRGAETAAAAAGDRLTAVQSLLAAREAELGRAREELADSQAARAALQAEERRLALAVTSLGGRVESEVETLRAEVAALKRGAVSREALLAEITVGTGLGFTHGAGNHGRACRRRGARSGGEGPGWPRARAAWGPLAARLCPRSVFASTRLATLFTDPARCMCLISALWALNAWNAALRWLLLLPGGVSYGECLPGPKTPGPGMQPQPPAAKITQSQGKTARATARQREDDLGARLAAAEEEAAKQKASCESALGTLARLRSILLQSDRAAGTKHAS